MQSDIYAKARKSMSSKFGVNSKPAANSDAYRNNPFWGKKDDKVIDSEFVLERKRDLCVSLKMQKEIMEENAQLMKEVYPNGNHIELLGAAKITQAWIDSIEKEEGVKGIFV